MISSAGTAGLDSLTTLCEEYSSHLCGEENSPCPVLEGLSNEISGIVEDQSGKLGCHVPGVFNRLYAGDGFRCAGKQDNATHNGG